MTTFESFKGRLPLAGLALLVLSVGAIRQNGTVAEAGAQDDPPPAVETPAASKKLSGPVSISFSLAKLNKEPATVFSVCSLDPPPQGSAPIWKQWATFDGKRLRADSSAKDSVPAYAVRTHEGAALCVKNQTAEPAEIRMNARLPKGVFTIERLESDATESRPSVSVRRLPGVLLTSDTSITKTATVPAGGIAVFRLVNRTQQALGAFRSAKHKIKVIRSGSASEYHSLMVPFGECESNIAVIARGINERNRYSLLKHIHRAILTAAHAQALSRNFTSQGRIDKASGETLTAKLDLLDEALCELSVACLGLNADTIVDTPGSNGASKVTVLLTNAGSRTITFVKIGAISAGKIQVKPDELATFGAVRPGETAKAEFSVQCANSAELCNLAAHIGYLAGKSPVRLKLKPVI